MSLDEATPLATVLVDRIAKLENIHALILKGPLASIENLRPPRPSYDVDILVAPEQFDALIHALTARGWQLRPTTDFPTLLPKHSRSLSHLNWPVDIDIHWNWPGFLTTDEDAFAELWARHRNASLAGTEVHAPSRADTALILALHILRESRNLRSNVRRQAEYEFLVNRVWEEPDTRAGVRQAAAELHAEHTARRFLEDLGFSGFSETAADPVRLAIWDRHQRAEHPVAGWLHELNETPVWLKPITVWQAVFPSPASLRAIDPFIGKGPLELMRGWWRRFRRGIRTLPEARQGLRTTRHDNAQAKDLS